MKKMRLPFLMMAALLGLSGIFSTLSVAESKTGSPTVLTILDNSLNSMIKMFEDRAKTSEDASRNLSLLQKQKEQLPEDPGTLLLQDGSSKFHLTNIGLSHFYRKEEFDHLLSGFSVIDPCLTNYFLPRQEAKKRGYDEYLQSMWTVYAVK